MSNKSHLATCKTEEEKRKKNVQVKNELEKLIELREKKSRKCFKCLQLTEKKNSESLNGTN